MVLRVICPLHLFSNNVNKNSKCGANEKHAQTKLYIDAQYVSVFSYTHLNSGVKHKDDRRSFFRAISAVAKKT